MRIRGRGIVRGIAEGEVIVSESNISFLGDIDPITGKIKDKENLQYGKSITGKIFVFPEGRGSTVGSYVMYQMMKLNTAPAGIINIKTEPIIAVGAVISDIPLMDRLEKNPLKILSDGDHVRMDCYEGWLEIY
jgi:hypothetical protein